MKLNRKDDYNVFTEIESNNKNLIEERSLLKKKLNDSGKCNPLLEKKRSDIWKNSSVHFRF